MSEIETSEDSYPTVRNVDIAAQIKTTAVPLRDYDIEDKTVGEEVNELPAFEDFQLDLSCLSSSPPVSLSNLPPANTSPSLSPRSSQSDTTPILLPLQEVPSRTSGTWPLMAKYVGRGTPVDKHRRTEWGGIVSEVGEDGLLFTNRRSTSMDSALRLSRRSVSLDKDSNLFQSSSLYRRPSKPSSRHSQKHSIDVKASPETPEIKIEGLESGNSAEWASSMQAMWESTESNSVSTSNTPTPETCPKETSLQENSPDQPLMSPEEMRKLSSELGVNLDTAFGLDSDISGNSGQVIYSNTTLPESCALNNSNLGVPESGRDSPGSVYSTPPDSSRVSPLPIIDISDNRSITSTKAEPNAEPASKPIPIPSLASTKAEINGGSSVKLVSVPWWRKLLKRFRRFHSSLRSH